MPMLRTGVTALRDWRPWLLVVVCALLLLLLAQFPFSYSFIAGKERGQASDLPFLQGFKAAESAEGVGRWRWSDAQATIEMPAIGHRSVILGLNIVSHRANRIPNTSDTVVSVQMGNHTAVPLTLRRSVAHYQLYIPASALEDGRLRLHLATEPWQAPDDRRANLGVAIGERITVQSIGADDGVVLPELLLVLTWSCSLVLFWLALRVMDFSPRLALLLLLPLALAIPFLTLIEAPRLGFGNAWIVQAGLLSLAGAIVSVWLVPPLLRRLNVVPPAGLLRWLLLLMVVSFVLKYGGRLYPESMPGDLQLHINRYLKTVLLGQVYIPAQHRGLPFPFPNGLYVLLAPLTLTGLDIRFWLPFTAGLFEATTVLLLYLMAARVAGQAQWGVLAAAVYALTAGGFMNTWFSFATQVAAQWFTIVLLVVLVVRWPHYDDWLTWGWIVMLFIQVFLGHIGQFINTVLVGVLLLPLLWWRASTEEERRGVRWLTGAGVAAALFVTLFYYSAFWDLIVEQTVGVTTQGLNEVTGRQPIPRTVSLQVLWEGGLITHFGFFPVLLAVPGALLLAAGKLRQRRSILPLLLWLTFVVSSSQALLPFITLNSITTRWLMFSSWAIAVAAGYGVLLLWRRGRSARLAVVTMTGYVCWITLLIWVEAMALRKPPIEPF